MDGTFICNLEQLRSLFGRQGSSKVNVPLNPIKHSFFGFALGAIGSVDLRVSQIDSNLLERPSFPSSIHPNGDRSAGSQGGEQKIVRRRSRVRATYRQRFDHRWDVCSTERMADRK